MQVLPYRDRASFFLGILGNSQFPRFHIDFNLKFSPKAKRVYDSAEEGLEDKFSKINNQTAQFKVKPDAIVF